MGDSDEATEPGKDRSESSATKRRNGRSRIVLERLLEGARERVADLPQIRTERDYYRKRCKELETVLADLRLALKQAERTR